MDLDGVVDELYGLNAAEFTATRDARAAEARRDGDKPLAAAIKALRRPSTAAWAVNMLSRRRADDVGALLELGAQLREAQASLSGDELRVLGRQRQQVVATLARTARDVARDLGTTVGESVQREIETTLDAALADPGAAGAVASGRLLRGLERAGLEGVDLEGAVAGTVTPDSAARRSGAPAEEAMSPRRPARLEEARRRADETARLADAAEAALSSRSAELDAARDRAGAAQARLREVSELFEAARRESDAASAAQREAGRARDAARVTADSARRDAEQARARLEALA